MSGLRQGRGMGSRDDGIVGARMTGRLPLIPFLREQITTARKLSPDQPGVIRMSCFDAEAILAAIDAADE